MFRIHPLGDVAGLHVRFYYLRQGVYFTSGSFYTQLTQKPQDVIQQNFLELPGIGKKRIYYILVQFWIKDWPQDFLFRGLLGLDQGVCSTEQLWFFQLFIFEQS